MENTIPFRFLAERELLTLLPSVACAEFNAGRVTEASIQFKRLKLQPESGTIIRPPPYLANWPGS